ncbi:MAG: DEAD/DEAH box helicase [Patescibacteria group bacterium]|nr:DEAD/DEAH box helicase [Patescibacteria group bacterium]
MSFGESSHRMFEPKSLEELETQVEDSEIFWDESLLPSEHRENTEEIMHMSVEEIKEKYPVRYKIYLQSLRELKSLEKGRDGLMSLKELDVLKMRLRMLNNLDEYVYKVLSGERETHLREHQMTTFEKLRDFLEKGSTSGYIELPTGIGKTVIFIEFLRVLDVPSIIVVPTKDLVKQTKKRLKQFAKNLDVGAVYDKAKEYGSKVLVTTYDSLPKLLEHEKFDLDDLGLAILDEAHESLSEKRSEVVERLKKKSVVIGFTATSEYSETKNVGKLLGEKIHEMSVQEAIESSALAPCSAMVATTKIDISNVTIKSNGEYDEEELSKAINIEARNKAVTEMSIKTFANKQKILFCGSVDHCKELADSLNKAGEVAEVVVGETQDKVEEKYQKMGFKGGWKEAYEEGVIKNVLSVDLIIRGTDLPSAEVCMNVSPTASLVKATQRGGRVTRLDPNNPNKHAIVVDFVDLGEDGKYSGKSILFYEILGGMQVLPKGKQENGKGSVTKDEKNDEEKYQKELFEKPIIEGLKVVVDLEEMERLVHREKETEEEIKIRCINIIKEQINVEDFCRMGYKEKKKFRLIIASDKKSLRSVASIFGIEGDPVDRYENHISLARAIYGNEEVDKVLEQSSPEKYREVIKAQINVEDFCRMVVKEKKEFKIIIANERKGLRSVASIFGIVGDPVGRRNDHILLAKAIYGEDAVNEALDKNK